MASLVSKTYSKKLLRLISWSHWFTFFNIIAAILLSSLYLLAEPLPETGFGQFYLFTNWFGHTAFLTFIGFVILVFPIILIFPATRFIRGFSSLIFTLYLSVLVLDTFTYSALGYHLNAQSSEQIIQLITGQINKDPKGFWLTTIIIMGLILAFQLLVSNYVWRHINQLQQTHVARYGGILLAVCFIFSHVTHIWADAELNYDVLQQDNVLPFSYPTTAKTLLTKYGLFEKDLYLESRTKPLRLIKNIPQYPIMQTCEATTNEIKQSAIIVLNKNQLSAKQVDQFIQRASTNVTRVSQHVDDASLNNAWFNFFYGLPTIYQEKVLEQKISPLWFQLLENKKLAKSFTIVSDSISEINGEVTTQNNLPAWLKNEFNELTYLNNAASLVFGEKLTSITKQAGLHVFYFDNKDDYQLNLFVDGLLLSQAKKDTKDIIWVSSLGNLEAMNAFLNKPVLFISPNLISDKIRVLTSNMDVQATFISQWLKCSIPENIYTTGTDILTLDNNRIIANTSDDGMMIYDKDKSIFVNKEGNFEGYSRRLAAPIQSRSNYPLLIDGVHYLKQFNDKTNK